MDREDPSKDKKIRVGNRRLEGLHKNGVPFVITISVAEDKLGDQDVYIGEIYQLANQSGTTGALHFRCPDIYNSNCSVRRSGDDKRKQSDSILRHQVPSDIRIFLPVRRRAEGK